MSSSKAHSKGQRGAALIIVLLLAAALAFVVLTIIEQTSLTTARSVNERARSESLWRALGAETLGAAAIEAVLEASPDRMSLDDPWAVEPLVVPMEDGAARLFFIDATRCFNVNSLAQESGVNADAVAEFIRLARHLGLGDAEGERIAQTIIDWIDLDNARQPQGAEDEYYTSLAEPYRTGGAPLADISELRAMRGMTRELYAALKPYLCAHPDGAPSNLNINMLREGDAPVLAAALGEDLSVGEAEAVIAARPPGGYEDLSNFWSQPPLDTLNFEQNVKSRIKLTSQYLLGRAEIAFDTAFLEMTIMYDLAQGGNPRVLRRRLGASE